MSGMNMFCACLTRRRSDQVEKLCMEQFDRIRAVYPGTHYVCLLDNETGEIVAQTEIPALNTEDLTRTIITLKRAAMQFAATMNQMDSQVVHIKGDERMFSCFGGERTVLAFYTQMPAIQLEFFDCSEADKTVDSVNAELNRIAYAPSRWAALLLAAITNSEACALCP